MKMKSQAHRAVALSLSLMACTLALAQSPPVFESHDKSGPVFSDQAAPGASRVDLPPPNVIQTAPVDPAAMQAPPPPGPAYNSLQIVSPVNGGTIHSNTGAFEVRVQSQPELRNGDRYHLSLDGNLIPVHKGSSLHVRPSDWQGAAVSTSHTLNLAIIDRQGNLLIQAPPVQFYAHRAAVGHR